MTTYVKTTWNTGDVITAARMTNLETQYDDVFTGGTFTGLTSLTSYDLKATTLSTAANVLTVDMATQNVVPFSFNANITTTTINNRPASGKYGSILWLPTADGSVRTWAWLTATVLWDGDVIPTFVTTAGHVMGFHTFTVDGGATWRGLPLAGNWSA